jgi:NADH:ubiquinone oxidoreductase subunit 4 (subunit M)
LILIIIFLGIYPAPFLNLMTSSVNLLVGIVTGTGGVAIGN